MFIKLNILICMEIMRIFQNYKFHSSTTPLQIRGTLVRYLPTNIPYESLMKEIVKSLVLGYRSKESCKNRIGRQAADVHLWCPTYLLLSPRKYGRNNHTQACKGCVGKNPPPSSQSEGKDIQNFMKFLVSIVQLYFIHLPTVPKPYTTRVCVFHYQLALQKQVNVAIIDKTVNTSVLKFQLPIIILTQLSAQVYTPVIHYIH